MDNLDGQKREESRLYGRKAPLLAFMWWWYTRNDRDLDSGSGSIGNNLSSSNKETNTSAPSGRVLYCQHGLSKVLF